MTTPRPRSLKALADQLQKLRGWRNYKDHDRSLKNLPQHFDRAVARPYRQLAQITELWTQLIPIHLVSHTRLDSLTRGVLQVSVDSSGTLYELDRALRCGLEDKLKTRHTKGSLKRVRLRIARLDMTPESHPTRQP